MLLYLNNNLTNLESGKSSSLDCLQLIFHTLCYPSNNPLPISFFQKEAALQYAPHTSCWHKFSNLCSLKHSQYVTAHEN